MCPAGNDTVRVGYDRDSCGCLHCVITDCSNAVCPAIACAANSQTFYPPGSCCPICVTPPSCESFAACPPAPTCVIGSKLVVPDGACCPICVPVPRVCPSTPCPALLCATGEALVTLDTECCPVCRPVDACAAVLCPNPTANTLGAANSAACPEIFVSNRSGACCQSCSPCRLSIDDPTNHVTCDRNDNPVCDAASTGVPPNCVPVDPSTLVQVCRTYTANTALTGFNLANLATGATITSERILKYLVANCQACNDTVKDFLLNHLANLRVSFVSRNGDVVTFQVCFVKPASDSNTDVSSLSNVVQESLVSQGAGTTTGSAATLVASFALVLLAAVAALF